MKFIVSVIICMCSIFAAHADIVQEGNNFRVEQTTAIQSDTLTPYTYTDKDGIIYPIYKGKNGSYYILKVSKKTGKIYKYYLPKEIQEKIK